VLFPASVRNCIRLGSRTVERAEYRTASGVDLLDVIEPAYELLFDRFVNSICHNSISPRKEMAAVDSKVA
jgi:hypothetical protein